MCLEKRFIWKERIEYNFFLISKFLIEAWDIEVYKLTVFD